MGKPENATTKIKTMWMPIRKETVMNVLLVGAAAMANNAAAPDKRNFGRWAIQSRHILLFNKHH